MKPPLIILGIPNGSWVSYGADIAIKNNPKAQAEFVGFHDRFLGSGTAAKDFVSVLNKRSLLPGEQLQILATSLRQDSAKRTVVADQRSCWLGFDLMAMKTKPEILAFYERPESVLASSSSESGLFEVLENWQAGAEQLLSLLRRYRSETTLISWEEACSNTDAWESCLRDKFALDSEISLSAVSYDHVRLALARMVVSESRKTTLLLAELEAASHLLAKHLSHPRLDSRELIETAWKHSMGPVALVDSEESGLKSKLKDTEEENELLLLQLHQVQEELEHYFLENRRLERGSLISSIGEENLLQIDALRVGDVQDSAPHRHIDFSLENARQGERMLGTLALRLVEHHGRPGVVVFHGSGDGEPPLRDFCKHGEENGRDYMLLVPQDSVGRDFLVAATTRDLLFLYYSAKMLGNYLAADEGVGSGTLKRTWQPVAQRFIELLEDTPSRLHYDDMRCAPRGEQLFFEIHQAWIPGRRIPTLSFVWSGSEIRLQPAQDGMSILTNWPTDNEGKPLREAVFRLDSSKAALHQERPLWNALTARDKTLVRMVVNELPNFLHHFVIQNPDHNIDRPKHLRLARAMSKVANRLQRPAHKKKFLGLF